MLNPPQDDEPEASRGRRAVAAAVLGVVVIAAVAVVAIVVTTNGDDPTPSAAPASTTTTAPAPTTPTVTSVSSTTTAATTVDCSYRVSGTAARPVTVPPAQAPASGTITGELTTTAGPIGYVLDRAEAPCTVASLVSLATQSYFDSVPCSELTTAGPYLLQCGDPTGTGTGGPGYTVPDEVPATGATYPRGTMAMANAGTPDSGGSQFFLVYRDSPLPPSYTVFGTITEAGLATLDAIAAAGTSDGSTDGPPATRVDILALSGY